MWDLSTLPIEESDMEMSDPAKSLLRLDEVAHCTDEGQFDLVLEELARSTAERIGAARCSILLANRGEPTKAAMTVCGSFGSMPADAFKELIGLHQGIAGTVAATGKSVLIDDIRHSPFAPLARRGSESAPGLMCAPISIRSGIIGVVNVSDAVWRKAFNTDSLRLLEVHGLLIGKSVQLLQVQGILKSRFAQLALAADAAATFGKPIEEIVQNPDQVSRIMARSFYREMAKAGFGTKEIINAASEIIAQLSSNIQRHNKRIAQEMPPSEE